MRSHRDIPEELTIRCFCARKPLLAVCGRDSSSGDLFVHIKSAKKDRINTEVVVTSGICRIRCRDCLRWHKVNIKTPNVNHSPEPLPASIVI